MTETRQWSPPAREAWIEIAEAAARRASWAASPPAREAWIEMPEYRSACPPADVASREGGVD